MKKRFSHLCLSLTAACVLAACGSTSTPSQSEQQTAGHTRSAAASSSTCRMTKSDAPGAGRKVVYRCDGRAVLASAEAKSVLNGGADIHFGSAGAAVKSGLITRQAARRFGTSDEAACERAYLNAAKKFQEVARAHGGTKVANFQSYLDKKAISGGQYECEVGTFHGRVVIRADVVR